MSGPWSIPESWQWSTMGKVAAVVGGGTPKTDHAEYYGGDIPWITPADLSGYTEKLISRGARSITQAGLEKSGARLMPTGTVLFSSRAPIGYVAVATNPVSTNQGFKSFVLRNGLTPDYVYYYLQHAKKLAVELASGTTFLEISGKKAGQIPIPIPPLDEQRRIVAEIEKQFTRLEAGVAGLRRVQANLKRYRAAVLKAACEGKLVPTESAQVGVRVGWQQIELGEVVESMKNVIYKPRNFYVDDGTACLRMYNIEIGKIVWKDVKRMRLTRDEEREYGLLPGDLLVNRVNSRELVGKAAPIPFGLEPCVFESKNIRVRLKRDLADPRFIGFAMSVYGPTHFNRNAQQVVGMASISQPQVSALKIPLPPVAEQEQIVAEVERRLSVVEELEAVVAANLQHGTRLRQSILKQAFCGTLVSSYRTTEGAERVRA